MDQGQTPEGMATLQTDFERLGQLCDAKQQVLERYERGETSAGAATAFHSAVSQLWSIANTLGITERQLTTAGSP